MFNGIEILELLAKDKLCTAVTLTSEEIRELSRQIHQTGDEIQKDMILAVFRIEERLTRFYIRNCQKRLISLSNQVYTQSGKKHTGQLTAVFLEVTDNLLSFTEDNFPDLVCPDTHIPHRLRDTCTGILQQRAKQAAEFLQCDDTLCRLTLRPIFKFTEAKQEIKYSTMRYALLYTDQLIRKLAEDGSRESLRDFFLTINYNSIPVMQYLCNEITIELENTRTEREQTGKLLWYLKYLNQLQTLETAYNEQRKPLKEMLAMWIREELEYREKTTKLICNTIMEEKSGGEFSLITDLSVPQFAFLVRVFLDTGLFKNQNHRAVARFFAKYIRTRGGNVISPESLTNKFYERNGKVEDSVKGILIQMINQIHRYK